MAHKWSSTGDEAENATYGKKIFEPKDNYRKWDYLAGGPSGASSAASTESGEGRSYLSSNVGKQGLNQTKFHEGFTRRQEDAINPYRERKDQEKIKEARKEKQNKLNRENKMKQWAKQSEERKRAQRRHISEKRNEVEDFIRLRNSESRFYGDTSSTTRCKQIVNEGFVTTKKRSSLLGWGTADLASSGTKDAFVGKIVEQPTPPRPDPRPF